MAYLIIGLWVLAAVVTQVLINARCETHGKMWSASMGLFLMIFLWPFAAYGLWRVAKQACP